MSKNQIKSNTVHFIANILTFRLQKEEKITFYTHKIQ